MMLRFSPLWLCALVLLVGCNPATSSPTNTNTGNYGRFDGDVVAVWDHDGRNMTLRDDFAYIDAQGRRWEAPANSVINGASIPQGFWTFIGGPFEGRYRNASVVHDVGCHQMTDSWEDVHRMFYEACLCGGVDETKASMMYYAVYHFGPRWKTVSETQLETHETPNGQLVQQPVTVQTVLRMDPVPPTPDEVAQVAEFVSEDKPNQAAIREMSRDALHRRPRRGYGGRRPDGTSWSRPPAARPNSAVATSDRPPTLSPQVAPAQRMRTAQWQAPAPAREVTPAEQQWARGIVAAHLERQAGAPVPADLNIRPTPNGYRIFVQYLQYDEQGQPFYYPGGHCSIWLTRDGQIREVTNNHEREQTQLR